MMDVSFWNGLVAFLGVTGEGDRHPAAADSARMIIDGHRH